MVSYDFGRGTGALARAPFDEVPSIPADRGSVHCRNEASARIHAVLSSGRSASGLPPRMSHRMNFCWIRASELTIHRAQRVARAQHFTFPRITAFAGSGTSAWRGGIRAETDRHRPDPVVRNRRRDPDRGGLRRRRHLSLHQAADGRKAQCEFDDAVRQGNSLSSRDFQNSSSLAVAGASRPPLAY